MRLRFSSSRRAGTVRTDVAVGTVRLSSIRRAMTAAAPVRGVVAPSGVEASVASGWSAVRFGGCAACGGGGGGGGGLGGGGWAGGGGCGGAGGFAGAGL